VFDNTGGAATGVAIANLTKNPVSIIAVIRDLNGVALYTGPIKLPANGHSSFTLTDQFPSTANLQGTVEFDPPAGVQISALGIRFPNSRAFTSIPVITP